jgi:hypothetical protein
MQQECRAWLACGTRHCFAVRERDHLTPCDVLHADTIPENMHAYATHTHLHGYAHTDPALHLFNIFGVLSCRP